MSDGAAPRSTPADPSVPPAPAVAAFVRLQLETLEPFEFISIGTPRPPFAATQIGRTQQQSFEVRVPPQEDGRPIPVQQRARLVELGFHSENPAEVMMPWVKEVSSLDVALDTALTTMRDVLGGDVGRTLDLVHGSTKAFHEARQRLDELRRRIEPMLAELTGQQPRLDEDGDYGLQVGPVHVMVVPRSIPGAMTVVRVVSVTNSDVAIGPELGLFLARLNFGLMFGRFALDVEHRAIWFDETLLGDHLTMEELRFTVEMVARTTQEWRPRLQQMFGGKIDDGPPSGSTGPSGPSGTRGPKPGVGVGGYL